MTAAFVVPSGEAVQFPATDKPDGPPAKSFEKSQGQISVVANISGICALTHIISDPRYFWLVSAVHLAPAPRFAREEWESRWTSLTFELAK